MSRRLALVLFLARLIRKPLPMSMKSLLPSWRQSVCRLSAVISSWLSYLLFLGFMLAVRTPPTCSTFCYLGNGCVSFQPFHQALHIVLACDDCRMAVNGGKPATFIVIYPLFRVSTPHASASSKMPSNTLIGSLNFTISVW